MLWYRGWFASLQNRKADSIKFTGPLLRTGSKGLPHLRLFTCLCAVLGASLFGLSAAGQSTGPAVTSEKTLPPAEAQTQDTNTPPPTPQPTPAAPVALPTPFVTGPLQQLPPAIFDAGPFGKLAVNGILSGLGLWQSNHVPGDESTQAALSNGQVFIQKTDGWFQFYLQAGAYNIPALGTPFLATDKAISDLYGPLPVAFLKLVAGEEHLHPHRRAAHPDRRRVHVQLRKYEHRAWPVVEPGKRRQSRNPSESDPGQIHSLIELERRLLFQPLLVAVGFLNLCQWAP